MTIKVLERPSGLHGALVAAGMLSGECSRTGTPPAPEGTPEVASHDASGSEQATLRDGGGARAVATEDANSATQEPVQYAHSEAALRLADGTTLPGPCVDPVAHAGLALRDGGLPSVDYRVFFEKALISLDIDGDGKSDFVVSGGGVRAQRSYHLYVRRAGCGYYVGTVPLAEDLKAGPSTSHGLRDVRATSDECPISHRMQYCEGVWRFDGKSYVLYAERRVERKRPPPEVDIGSGFDSP